MWCCLSINVIEFPDSGQMWGPDGRPADIKALIPDHCYGGIYQEAADSSYLPIIKALKQERQALFELSKLKSWPELSLLLPRPRCEQNTCMASYSDIFDDIFGKDKDNDKDDQEGKE